MRRGAVPLFVTPYVSVAAIYARRAQELTWDERQGNVAVEQGPREPVTYALLLPRDGVLIESSRAHETQGILYSLTFDDAEYVIDARQVKRIWVVPSDLVSRIDARVQKHHFDLTRGGQFRGAYKDANPDFAEQVRADVLALREPAPEPNIPFLNRPMPSKWGPLQANTRLLLKDGSVVKLRSLREQKPVSAVGGGVRWRRNAEVRWSKPLWLSVAKLDSPLDFDPRSVRGYNARQLDGWWGERALEPGERISKQDRALVLERNRRAIARWLKKAVR